MSEHWGPEAARWKPAKDGGAHDTRDWLTKVMDRHAAIRDAREEELTRRGVGRFEGRRIADREAHHRMDEIEERAASRDPETFYGHESRETYMPFRRRAEDARTVISRGRERFAETMQRDFPGWTPPRGLRPGGLIEQRNRGRSR